jgi:hypothetical protein
VASRNSQFEYGDSMAIIGFVVDYLVDLSGLGDQTSDFYLGKMMGLFIMDFWWVLVDFGGLSG